MRTSNPYKLIDRIAKKYGTTREEVMRKNRTSHLKRIRTEIYEALREKPFRYSFPAIGRLFDRHHSTIIHSIRNGK